MPSTAATSSAVPITEATHRMMQGVQSSGWNGVQPRALDVASRSGGGRNGLRRLSAFEPDAASLFYS